MKLKCLWFLCFCLIGMGSFAQSTDVKSSSELFPDDNKFTPGNLAKAKFQIFDIKKRGIVIRLKTEKARIEGYRKSGYLKQADQIQAKQTAFNLLLMHSFITTWTFCPVYFMESQNTLSLILHDSLVARTYDLMRDTVIYMNHDSFYMIDYGALMANEALSDNISISELNKSEQSNTPVGDKFLVVKDQKQKQLQEPMPYFAEDYTYFNLKHVDNFPGINDHDKYFRYRFFVVGNMSRDSVRHAEGEGHYQSGVDIKIPHVKGQRDSLLSKPTLFFNAPTIALYMDSSVNTTMQKSVDRLNRKYIAYYCKRLDKDKNIVCDTNKAYWWRKNPNKEYLKYLLMIEDRFADYVKEKKKHTK